METQVKTMNEVKNGLIMEGGAMRGMFTAGVIDVLMENGITFDGAIGVSAGATFGCNFKSHQIGRVIRYNKTYCHDKRYGSFLSFVKTGDYYGADFCYRILPEQLDVYDLATYRNNPMPFYVVASDCTTGQPVYRELKTCDKDDLTWMRASASMPIASRVVRIDGHELLDGGITDSIPLKHFEKMGFGRNLVILTQPKEYQKKRSSLLPLIKLCLRKYPKIVEAMEKRHTVYNEQKAYVFREEEKGSVLAIYPSKDLGIKRTEHNPRKLQKAYDEGRLTAKTRMQEIKNFLKK